MKLPLLQKRAFLLIAVATSWSITIGLFIAAYQVVENCG